jgi:hypothetical protein
MKETVFKVGDRVYCLLFGWGTIIIIDDYDDDYVANFPIDVAFVNSDGDDMVKSYTPDGRYFLDSQPTLSFTEYTLNGFSQERPMDLPEVGEEIMVSDDEMHWRLATFRGYHPQYTKPFEAKFADNIETYSYRYFKRLR